VVEFEKDKMFIFAQKGRNYYVRYIFTPIGENKTELEYFEWVEKGVLEKPFTMDILKKPKKVLEKDKNMTEGS